MFADSNVRRETCCRGGVRLDGLHAVRVRVLHSHALAPGASFRSAIHGHLLVVCGR